MDSSSTDGREWRRQPRAVSIARVVPGPAERVWRALTDPAVLREWFGTATSPFAVDNLTTVTLLDGDIFLAQLIAADPPTTVRYVWAALGIGVEDTITWHITPDEGGCLVTVTDDEPERDAVQAARAARRWREILWRLERHLAGHPLTVPCQDQFDASVEFAATVEGASALLLEQAAHSRWLPLGGTALADGATMHVDDGLDPAVFQVTDVHADADRNRMSFQLGHPGWARSSRVLLEVRPRTCGASITVCHDGWRGISPDALLQQRQRIRWCTAWSNALRRFTLLYVRGRELQSIPAQELHARLGEQQTFVFDTNVRSRWERGHLRGAIHLGPEPLSPDVLPRDKTATLVFYCLSPV